MISVRVFLAFLFILLVCIFFCLSEVQAIREMREYLIEWLFKKRKTSRIVPKSTGINQNYWTAKKKTEVSAVRFTPVLGSTYSDNIRTHYSEIPVCDEKKLFKNIKAKEIKFSKQEKIAKEQEISKFSLGKEQPFGNQTTNEQPLSKQLWNNRGHLIMDISPTIPPQSIQVYKKVEKEQDKNEEEKSATESAPAKPALGAKLGNSLNKGGKLGLPSSKPSLFKGLSAAKKPLGS